MTIHLIQPREEFGPPERIEELRECWRRNDAVFDRVTVPPGRPTFSEMFDLCLPSCINVIANSDIYFDSLGLHNLKAAYFTDAGQLRDSRQCFAMSRWDVDEDGHAKLWNHADSQDAWVIYGMGCDIDAPFPMGVPGCDNALAYILDAAGFVVSNPSLTIRAYCLRNAYVAAEEPKPYRIPPPYKLVTPTAL